MVDCWCWASSLYHWQLVDTSFIFGKVTFVSVVVMTDFPFYFPTRSSSHSFTLRAFTLFAGCEFLSIISTNSMFEKSERRNIAYFDVEFRMLFWCFTFPLGSRPRLSFLVLKRVKEQNVLQTCLYVCPRLRPSNPQHTPKEYVITAERRLDDLRVKEEKSDQSVHNIYAISILKENE